MIHAVSRRIPAAAPRFHLGLARHRAGLALAIALAVMPVSAALGTELVPVDKVRFEFTDFEDKPSLRVIVAQPMTVKLGGAFGLMGYRYVLEAGTYRDVRQTRIDGREYVVLPVEATLNGRPYRGGDGSLGSVGGCYTSDGYFIAIEVVTGDVLNRGLLRNERSASCGGGARMDWHHSLSRVEAPGEVRIVWGEEAAAMDRHEVDSAVRAQIAGAVVEADRDRATHDAKTQIGARICRQDGSTRYVGFTEGVSPDNGKIQIRVVDATLGNSSTLRPGDFEPSIIWAHPDDWELCE